VLDQAVADLAAATWEVASVAVVMGVELAEATSVVDLAAALWAAAE
jgi:hypothetical protein